MRITREGWIIIFFGFLALSVYLRIFTPLTLLTSLALLIIPSISIAWTLISIRGIRFTRKLPVEGVAGEEIFVTYRLVNYSRLPAFGVKLEDTAIRGYVDEETLYDSLEKSESQKEGFRPESSTRKFLKRFITLLGLTDEIQTKGFEEAHYKPDIQADFPTHFPPLLKGQWQEKSIKMKFHVRGNYLVGPARIYIKDPLGICTYSSTIEGFSVILVLPKWSTLKRFSIGGSSRILRDENIPREQEGWSPEFLGVREYKEGDPLKAVHWRLTAKHNQLMVRQFVQQVESSWGILVDLRKGTNAGKGAETSLEYMVSITAAILEHFDHEKIPHVLVLAHDDLTIREGIRGERIFDDVLRILAACRNDGTQMLRERALSLNQQYPQLSWVLITARKDSDIANATRSLLSYGGKVLVTQIDMNSFLVMEDTSKKRGISWHEKQQMEEMLKKWRNMWGEETENFDGVILSLGAMYYQVRRGDDLSMIYL